MTRLQKVVKEHEELAQARGWYKTATAERRGDVNSRGNMIHRAYLYGPNAPYVDGCSSATGWHNSENKAILEAVQFCNNSRIHITTWHGFKELEPESIPEPELVPIKIERRKKQLV